MVTPPRCVSGPVGPPATRVWPPHRRRGVMAGRPGPSPGGAGGSSCAPGTVALGIPARQRRSRRCAHVCRPCPRQGPHACTRAQPRECTVQRGLGGRLSPGRECHRGPVVAGGPWQACSRPGWVPRRPAAAAMVTPCPLAACRSLPGETASRRGRVCRHVPGSERAGGGVAPAGVGGRAGRRGTPAAVGGRSRP